MLVSICWKCGAQSMLSHQQGKNNMYDLEQEMAAAAQDAQDEEEERMRLKVDKAKKEALPTLLPTYLPAYLPTYLPTYPPASSS